MSPAWSWLIAALSLACSLLLARKRRTGWLLGIAANLAMCIYAARTGQDGFVAADALFLATNAHGWWAWRTRRPNLADLLDHHAPRRAAVRHAIRAREARR